MSVCDYKIGYISQINSFYVCSFHKFELKIDQRLELLGISINLTRLFDLHLLGTNGRLIKRFYKLNGSGRVRYLIQVIKLTPPPDVEY